MLARLSDRGQAVLVQVRYRRGIALECARIAMEAV
jgi:hypothetical protein